MKTLLSFGLLLFILSIGSLAIRMNAMTIPAAIHAQTPAVPQLLVLAQQCRRYGERYMQCDGEVKNISTTPIQHVKAVVSYYDQQRTFVTSDGALITYNPLMPGQRSPFQIFTPWHPHMAHFTIGFTTLWGETLAAQAQVTKAPATPRMAKPAPSPERAAVTRKLEALKARLAARQEAKE